jgi:Family of unknown function (DUF6510)
MSEPALWLDGNGVAGLLAEVFETDMTVVPRACGSCGEVNAVGAHRAYMGAGTVLRCPVCGDLAMRIAVLADRTVVQLTGSWVIELPRR